MSDMDSRGNTMDPELEGEEGEDSAEGSGVMQPRLESRGRNPSTTLPPSRAREVQRAFRARRAVHLAKLEDRVLVLESENALLRAQLALPPADRTVLGTGPTGKGKSLSEGGVPMSERVRAKRERDRKRGIKRSPEPEGILDGPSAKLARAVKGVTGGGDGVAGPSGGRGRLPSASQSIEDSPASPSISPSLANRNPYPDFPDFSALMNPTSSAPSPGIDALMATFLNPQPPTPNNNNNNNNNNVSWSDLGLPTPQSPNPPSNPTTDQSFAMLMGMLTRHPEFQRRAAAGGYAGGGEGEQGRVQQGQGQGQGQGQMQAQQGFAGMFGGMDFGSMGGMNFGNPSINQHQSSSNQNQNQNQNNQPPPQSPNSALQQAFDLLASPAELARPSSAPLPSPYHSDILSPAFPDGGGMENGMGAMSRAPMGLRLQPPNFGGEVNGNGKRVGEGSGNHGSSKRRGGGDSMLPPPIPSSHSSPSTSNSTIPTPSSSYSTSAPKTTQQPDLLSRLRYCCNLSSPNPLDPGLMVFASRLVLLLDCPFSCTHPPSSAMEPGWVSLVVAWTGIRVYLENNGQGGAGQGGGLGLGRLGAELVLKAVKERMDAGRGGVGEWLGCRREGGFGVREGLMMELVMGGERGLGM